MSKRTRRLVLVMGAMLLLVVPAVADAARRHSVTRHPPQTNNSDKGGGVLLANRPGGFYMGRLTRGEQIARHDTYTSRANRSQYHFGYAIGDVGQCLWLGPSRTTYGFAGYLTRRYRSVSNRCSQSQRRWLGGRSGGNIGSHFNCPASSRATFGTRTRMRRRAGLYYNLAWNGTNPTGGAARDRRATLRAGTRVWYRYTTRDRQKSAVYTPRYGWGFVVASKVPHVSGRWGRPPGPSRTPCSRSG
jgi:hypothetical protein